LSTLSILIARENPLTCAGLLEVDCDCNCDAVFPVDATSSEVAKPFLRFVFLAVTHAINENVDETKRASQIIPVMLALKSREQIELPMKSQAHKAAPLYAVAAGA
jgi:hypothetical protein